MLCLIASPSASAGHTVQYVYRAWRSPWAELIRQYFTLQLRCISAQMSPTEGAWWSRRGTMGNRMFSIPKMVKYVGRHVNIWAKG